MGKMVKQKVQVKVLSGIHFRPAGKITEDALKYKAAIKAVKGETEANLKSFLNLLAACIKCGDEIEIICDGTDEEPALQNMLKLFQDANLGQEEETK